MKGFLERAAGVLILSAVAVGIVWAFGLLAQGGGSL